MADYLRSGLHPASQNIPLISGYCYTLLEERVNNTNNCWPVILKAYHVPVMMSNTSNPVSHLSLPTILQGTYYHKSHFLDKDDSEVSLTFKINV